MPVPHHGAPTRKPPKLRTARRPRRPATLTEAAIYTGRHRVTLRRWIAEGKITGYRQGDKLLMVDLDELDRLTRPVTLASHGA
jgi:excisionase family DNA binding protein